MVLHQEYTNIIPPKDVNVVLGLAPKCLETVRQNFLNKKGFNSSYAIYQDGDAFETTCFAFDDEIIYSLRPRFEKEVISDLMVRDVF